MANVLQVIGLNTVTPQLEAGQTSNLDTYSMVSPLTIDPSGTAGYSGTNALTVTGNVSANALYQGTTNQAATTSIQLTASSVTSWIITGSGGQTIILPDATTLPVGAMFTFNNNQSSGAITVNVFGSGSAPATVQSGGYATVTLLTKSVAAGTWDVHYGTPSNVTWSTNTFNYPGAITGLTSASLGLGTATSLALGGATIGTNALAVTGTTYLNGQVGIGTSTLTTGYAVIGGTQSAAPAMLSVTGTNTNAGTSIYGINSSPALTGTTAATSYYGVLIGSVITAPAATSIANIFGLSCTPNFSSTSSISNAYSVYNGLWQFNSPTQGGTVTNANTYLASSPAISASATTSVTNAFQFNALSITQGTLNTITNAYSFYGNQGPTGATNTYNLYMAGNAANYLANSLTVGGGGTNNVLINGSTTATITAANAVSNAGGTQVTFTFTAAIGTAYPVGSSITTSGFTLAGFTNGTYAVVTSSRLAVTVTAAATASSTASVGGTLTQASPAIIAQGSDTNVSLNLVTKGTGTLQINGTAWQKTKITTFTSSGTYTPSSGCVAIALLVVGGGGGGGFGGSYAAVGGGSGGAAGGGGGATLATIPLSAITTPVTITIGSGGAGGQSGVTPTGGTIAGQGARGGITSFGTYFYGGGGGGGAPGIATTASGGGGGAWGVNSQGGFGTNAAGGASINSLGGAGGFGISGAAGAASTAQVGGGGGGGCGATGVATSGANASSYTGIAGGSSGGGFSVAGVAQVGAVGGGAIVYPTSVSFPSAGQNGVMSSFVTMNSAAASGAGGGGAGTSGSGGTNGTAGGSGAGGSGGGGGGAGDSTNSLVGGNGGSGGNGYVYVMEWF